MGPGALAPGESALDHIAGQVQRTMLVFNYTQPVDIYYAPPRPLLLWPVGVLLVFGLAYTARHWRQRAAFLLLAAFGDSSSPPA